MRHFLIIALSALMFGGGCYWYAYDWMQEKRDSDRKAIELWTETNKKLDVIIERLK